MKTYPPFQVITADNDQPVNEALNLAVYAALKQHRLDFVAGFKFTVLVRGRTRVFTNVENGSKDPKSKLFYGTQNDRTDILSFDARTDMGALCEFLDNPPKKDVTTAVKHVLRGESESVTISSHGVKIADSYYTHASILALAKAVEEFNA